VRSSVHARRSVICTGEALHIPLLGAVPPDPTQEFIILGLFHRVRQQLSSTPDTFPGPFEDSVHATKLEQHGGATSRTPTHRPSPSAYIVEDHIVALSRSPVKRSRWRPLARIDRGSDA
jgi:hypothetical protein